MAKEDKLLIKVCFQAMYFVLDSTSAQKMRDEFIRLAQKDSQLEFWFTGCHTGYEKTAVKYIKELGELFPDNQIDVVFIVDPVKYEKLDLDIKEVQDGFPVGAITKIEYAPRIEGKCEQNPHRFVEHHRKVLRWIIEQCDVLIAYHYDGVPDPTNTEIKRIRKKGNIEIIPIFNPEVAKAIDTYIDSLDGRDKTVLHGIRAGRTYKSLSEELGISQNRVQQISHHAIRFMMKEIRHKINS